MLIILVHGNFPKLTNSKNQWSWWKTHFVTQSSLISCQMFGSGSNVDISSQTGQLKICIDLVVFLPTTKNCPQKLKYIRSISLKFQTHYFNVFNISKGIHIKMVTVHAKPLVSCQNFQKGGLARHDSYPFVLLSCQCLISLN